MDTAMESKQPVNTTEELKQGLVKRIVLMVFGCIAATVLIGAMPLLYLVPVSREVSTRARPAVDTLPVGALVPPLVTLALLGLLAYGVYDVIRTFMRYRKSQKDDQMFP